MGIMASCISRIREIESKGEDLLDEERLEREQCYNTIFNKMDKEINYLIGKNKIIGYDNDDIRQELRMQIMDVIVPRLNRRKIIDKKTGEIKLFSTTVDITKSESEIIRFLAFSLTQKQMRMMRSIYGSQTKNKEKTIFFKNPLDGCISIDNIFDDEDEDTPNFELSDSNEWQNYLTQELQLKNIEEKLSCVCREILTKALESNSKKELDDFVKKREAKYALMRLKALLESEYGYTRKQKRRNTKIRREKQITKESICK